MRLLLLFDDDDDDEFEFPPNAASETPLDEGSVNASTTGMFPHLSKTSKVIA
jgi:hypothetical protein